MGRVGIRITRLFAPTVRQATTSIGYRLDRVKSGRLSTPRTLHRSFLDLGYFSGNQRPWFTWKRGSLFLFYLLLAFFLRVLFVLGHVFPLRRVFVAHFFLVTPVLGRFFGRLVLRPSTQAPSRPR
jgi:hypothetical protein